MVKDVEVGLWLAGCDHGVVSFEVVVTAGPDTSRPVRRLNLKRANYPQFVRERQELTLQPQDTAGELWQEFTGKYLEIQARCIPIKRVGGHAKRNSSWFTREIAAAIYERQALYRAARADPTPQSEALLYRQHRLVKRMIRQAKASEEGRVALACKDNPNEFYGYVNSHRVRKPLGPLQSSDGELVTEKLDIAREFNEYFSSVFTVEQNGLPDPVVVYCGDEPLVDAVFSQEEVLKKLTHLDPNKAPGPDGFLPKVMRSVASGLAPIYVGCSRCPW